MGPIFGIQLYSIRHACEADLDRALEKCAAIGYRSVETAGLHGLAPEQFRQHCQSLGLRIHAAHLGLMDQDNGARIADTAEALGSPCVVLSLPPDHFADEARCRDTAERLNRACELAATRNLQTVYHNHYWEMRRLRSGETLLQWLAHHCPGLLFELDLYWAANFGQENPAAILADLAPRCPLLHAKDGPLRPDQPMCALGDGKMDLPAALQKADPAVTRHVFVEMDECDGDLWESLAASHHYLTGLGLRADDSP